MNSKNQIIADLKSWIEYISIPQEKLNNWSICPFAKQVKSLEFIIVDNLNIDNIEQNIDKINQNQVTVITEGSLIPSFNEIDIICKFLNKKYQDLIFLPDHPNNPNFISTVETGNKNYALVIAQSKKKLLNSRKILEKNNYYNLWPDDYKKEIFSYGNES
jgi:hypothetical protein